MNGAHILLLLLVVVYVVLAMVNVVAWRVVLVHARHIIDMVAIWVAFLSAALLTLFLVLMLMLFW
ncbi:MAG: hypothetical protein D6802_05735 [Ardenticatenia bacterium]|nr:MAG: hypothetical protein D6802_05735 [Ardenticatenia bacterium]